MKNLRIHCTLVFSMLFAGFHFPQTVAKSIVVMPKPTIANTSSENRVMGKLSEGFKAFYEDGKMGFVNEKDEVVLPATLDIPDEFSLPFFSEGLCLFYEISVENEEVKYFNVGYLNKDFLKVIPAIYPYSHFYCNKNQRYFTNGLAVAQNPNHISEDGSHFILLDKTGRQIGNEFTFAQGFLAACYLYPQIYDNTIIFTDSSGEYFIDVTTNKPLSTQKYTRAGFYVDGIAPVAINDKYISFIDKAGKEVCGTKFYFYNMQPGAEKELVPSFLGGFVNGHYILEYFENEGLGDKVYALINTKGEVVKKMKIDYSEEYWAFRLQLEEYTWKMGD